MAQCFLITSASNCILNVCTCSSHIDMICELPLICNNSNPYLFSIDFLFLYPATFCSCIFNNKFLCDFSRNMFLFAFSLTAIACRQLLSQDWNSMMLDRNCHFCIVYSRYCYNIYQLLCNLVTSRIGTCCRLLLNQLLPKNLLYFRNHYFQIFLFKLEI